jgi:hypothetical protein
VNATFLQKLQADNTVVGYRGNVVPLWLATVEASFGSQRAASPSEVLCETAYWAEYCDNVREELGGDIEQGERS